MRGNTVATRLPLNTTVVIGPLCRMSLQTVPLCPVVSDISSCVPDNRSQTISLLIPVRPVA